MLWPKKHNTRNGLLKEFDNEKKFLGLENSPPSPPLTHPYIRERSVTKARELTV